jgi:hypothetical protein
MKYPKNEKKPSKMFLNALQGGGSHHMTCGYCGREHYCPDSDSVWEGDIHLGGTDPGDRPEYLADALGHQAKDPEGAIIHYNVDCVTTKDLVGIAFVEDCPCNGLRKYEEFIWSNRDSIRRYLKARVDQEAIWTEQERTKNKLAGIS